MNDKELLEVILKSIVGYPDSVHIDRTTDEMGVLLTVGVDKSDMGIIIGREGNTAKAIRTIIRTLGVKNQARVNVKILEPQM